MVAAERALDAIVDGVSGLAHFPNTGRKLGQHGQQFRELLIPFGRTGYFALYQLPQMATSTSSPSATSAKTTTADPYRSLVSQRGLIHGS